MYQRLIMLYAQHHTIAKLYVLYQDQQPASTGMVYFDNDIAIIDDLSTRLSFTKRGFAHIMINYLTKQAKKRGYHHVGLLATKAGLPLYLSFGFQPLHLYINEYCDNVHETTK